MAESDEEKQARLNKEAEEKEEAARERDDEEKTKKAAQEQEKKYSDEEVDRLIDKKFAEWKAKEAKKYGNLDELKAKADELDKLKDEGKGEVERLTGHIARVEKKAAEAEARAIEAELKLQKMTVLLDAKAPPERIPKILGRMQGTTDEELKADVEELRTLGFFEVPKGDGSEGNGSGKDPFAEMRNKAAQGSGKIPPAAGKERKFNWA
jgi:hypothetical protein